MNDTDDKPKKKYSSTFLLMLFCIFSFTVGQYLPIYFTDSHFRELYYFIILILIVVSVGMTIFKRIYKKNKDNISSAIFYSIIIGFATLVVFGLWTLGLMFSVWTEAATFYVQKDNPKIKIISRYINEGAFGGGTEKEDYHIVLSRPISSFFRVETSIDTAKIDKQKWRRPDN